MEKEPVIFYEACDGSESSVDSEELVDVKIGGEGENPGISSSANNDYSKTDANSAKTISSDDFFSLQILSNDFLQARKVNFDESSASEFVSKFEQIDASHGSIGVERDNPETSRSDNNDYLIIHTSGIKSVLIQDEASSSYSSSESSSNDFLQARKVKFAKLSASESESKDEDSDVSHENSKSTRGERKNLETSRSCDSNYLKTDTSDTKSILVPNETSSPSSSSESSSTDFSQTREANFAEFPSSKVASKDGESDVSRQRFIKSEPGNDFPVRRSTSPIYTLKRGHRSMSPTVAPPVQVMDRSPEYNSYRIPSSVFAVTTNPTDWTNDSDESLFSIQIGNPSFARDHLFTAPELRKSVELTKSGELNMFSPQPSVLIEDRDTCRKSVEIEDSLKSEMSDEDFKLEGNLDKNKNKNSHPAISYKSHGNGIGAQSSALPIEKKQEAPSSCSCLKCSLALCCWHASPVSPEVENHISMQTYNPQVTSDSTSNCCNLCQCFSWLCCTCCSHTDSRHQLSCEKSSKKTCRSTSSCCCCFKCCFGSCCSWDSCCCCLETDSTRHQSLDKSSEETSSSWSCCSWGCCCCCCSETNGTRHHSLDKASEETSSSWSWSCCSWGCCCCCPETYSTLHQSLFKASEETSGSWSWPWSCCSWDGCCCCCSETDSTRQKSLCKASEETSRSWFWACSCCSWDNCCCCCCCSEKDSRHQSLYKASEEASSSWFWSWSCCSWDSNSSCCCCCSETDSTRHQPLDEASEKASSSWSWSWSWSCCLSKENCSETNTTRHQSFLKTSEQTSSSTSNCCSWTCCSCCCC